jgi:hypothetical protein
MEPAAQGRRVELSRVTTGREDPRRADPDAMGGFEPTPEGADAMVRIRPLRTVRTSWGRSGLGLPDRRAGSDRRRAVRGQSPRWPSASSSVGLFHADRGDHSNRGRSYRLEGPPAAFTPSVVVRVGRAQP